MSVILALLVEVAMLTGERTRRRWQWRGAAGCRGGQGGSGRHHMRRQQGSGGSSSGQVDGSGEAVMGEEAAEVDERYFGTGSRGGDRAGRWRLGGGCSQRLR